MDFFLVFVFAHLTGDFVLQTNKIAVMKASTMKGLLIHSGLIFVVQVVFLSIYGIDGIVAGMAAAVIHFFIDYLKNRLQPYFTKYEFVYFLLDQGLHLIVICILTQMMQGRLVLEQTYIVRMQEYIPEFSGYIKTGIGLILLLYVSTVAVKIWLRDLFSNIKKEAFFKDRERIVDALVCAFLCFLWYLPTIWTIVAVLVCFFGFYVVQEKKFQYRAYVCYIKYGFFIISSGLVYFFISSV